MFLLTIYFENDFRIKDSQLNIVKLYFFIISHYDSIKKERLLQ